MTTNSNESETYIEHRIAEMKKFISEKEKNEADTINSIKDGESHLYRLIATTVTATALLIGAVTGVVIAIIKYY